MEEEQSLCSKLWRKNEGLKWKYSFYAALIFYVISLPQTYELTQKILGKIITTSSKGCPTSGGLAVHAFVFLLIMVALMSMPKDL